MKSTVFAGVLAAVLMPAAAHASEVIVTGGTGLPSATTWGVIASENTGTAVITSTVGRSGNGSVELRGDRTRFQEGIQYAVPVPTNIAPASSVLGLSFDWRIAGDSISGYNPDYTPALRLLVQDGSVRTELVWEGVYNGTYGNTQRDTWYSSTFADNFYQYNASTRSVTTSGGNQVNQTLAAWLSTYSSNAYVSTISVGAGSGALPTYHAFVDNVTLATRTDSTTYNFEVANVAAVPEPASWAMMILGMGAIGFGLRSAKRRSDARFDYKIKRITAGLAS